MTSKFEDGFEQLRQDLGDNRCENVIWSMRQR